MSKKIKVKMAYVGPCFTTENKPAGKWANLDAEGKPAGFLIFTGKHLRKARVGEIREFEQDEKTLYGEGSYRGRYAGPELLEWEAAAIDFATEAAGQKARSEWQDEAKRILAPLREVYSSRIGRANRAAYLAFIIQAITG